MWINELDELSKNRNDKKTEGLKIKIIKNQND